MSDSPVKPNGVPASARWIDHDQEWELGHVDEHGLRQGPFLFFRADGTICRQVAFTDDCAVGVFHRYHEDGEISQIGRFVGGQLHGEHFVFRGLSSSTERFPDDCGSEVYKVVSIFEMGHCVSKRAYNREGLEVLFDGSRKPLRPDAVPEKAEFDAKTRRWIHRQESSETEGSGRDGLCRIFAESGQLLEETLYSQGKPDGTRKAWNHSGRQILEESYRDGLLSGLRREWHPDSGHLICEENYADGRLNGVLRHFAPESGELMCESHYLNGIENGISRRAFAPGYLEFSGSWIGTGETKGHYWIGSWSFERKDGEARFELNFGLEPDVENATWSALVVNEVRPASEWLTLYRDSQTRGDHAGALLALTRHAAAIRARHLLFAYLRAHTLPVSADAAVGIAQESCSQLARVPMDESQNGPTQRTHAMDLSRYVSAVLRGASPEVVLRSAAIYCDQNGFSFLASDLIEAAQMLAPERGDYNFTHLLIAMSIGKAETARRLVAAVRKNNESDGAMLGRYVETCFRPFFFIDVEEEFSSQSIYSTFPVELRRDLQEVREKIKETMAWLTVIRERLLTKLHPEVREHAPKITWLPPDLSSLVEQDRLELHRMNTYQIEGIGVPDLLKEAHMMWRFLCTICWAVGLSDVALPETLRPRPALARVVVDSSARSCFMEDMEREGRSPLPVFPFLNLPVTEYSGHIWSWAQADMRGLAGALHFLCTPAGEESPVPRSHFDVFYADPHAPETSAMRSTDSDGQRIEEAS